MSWVDYLPLCRDQTSVSYRKYEIVLSRFWKNHFSDANPLAHELKVKFAERWVRFHSLPDSKRYPENVEEQREVLNRHNEVLQRLCSSDNDLYLIATEHSWESKPKGLSFEIGRVLEGAKHWRSLEMYDLFEEEAGIEDEDPTYWHLFYVRKTWESGCLDELLSLVANVEISNFMIVNIESAWGYHPYDGGADVLLRDRNEMLAGVRSEVT